jgi:hypothetical protein
VEAAPEAREAEVVELMVGNPMIISDRGDIELNGINNVSFSCLS